MSARPVVNVLKTDGQFAKRTVKMPAVLVAPIRQDIVHFVHSNMAKNKRQAYAVKDMAGMGYAAESWGTGRAVARIPRIGGGGTSRSGQGAFGNMCRGGRMFAPTKTWRRWHRRINTNQKRYAVASALAASALPALVMARGHRVDKVAEVPLVVDNAFENVSKTKDALAVFKALGALDDVEKAKKSRKIRCGGGKNRNRRHVTKRGPLVVYSEDNGVSRAVRNLPGVDVCSVERLNLLQLAPGGHLGRFIVWTEGAFAKLGNIYGSTTRASTQKKDYKLPMSTMTNADLTRVINSDEVQSVLRPAKQVTKAHANLKKNPLKNLGVMVKLNPYAMNLRRAELLGQEKRAAVRAARAAALKAGKEVQLTVTEARKRAAHKVHANIAKLTFKRISRDAYDVQATEQLLAQSEAKATAVEKKAKGWAPSAAAADVAKLAVELEKQARADQIKGLFNSKVFNKDKKNLKKGSAGALRAADKVSKRVENLAKKAQNKKALKMELTRKLQKGRAAEKKAKAEAAKAAAAKPAAKGGKK